MSNEEKESVYREAAIIWLKNNPNAKTIKLKVKVVLENGKLINLGEKMNYMRTNIDKLTAEQKNFWSNFGLYETRVVINKQEEYLSRLDLLRQYIIDWNYFSHLEKEELKNQKFIMEEIEFINNSRTELDNLILTLKKR